jgi:hypothetical protein
LFPLKIYIDLILSLHRPEIPSPDEVAKDTQALARFNAKHKRLGVTLKHRIGGRARWKRN